MGSFLRKAVLAAALVASTGVAAAPAEARDRYYRHHRGDNDAAIAIGAGLVGLAIGAAIASDNDRDRYYDDRYYYYDRRHYYPRQRYYYNGYPAYRPYPRYRESYRYRDNYRYRDRYDRRYYRGY
jgi:hypothetical protein